MKGKVFIGILLVVLLARCRKPFVADYQPPVTDFLVVGGFINTAPSSVTRITLSHTRALEDSISATEEQNATVLLRVENGSSYSLSETAPGIYVSDTLSLDTGQRFSLSIRRSSGETYESEYVRSMNTAPIDSVTWKQDGDVSIAVNTHENGAGPAFFQWEYVETWHYESTLKTIYGVKDNQIYVRDSTDQVGICWRDQYSTDILVGSTAALQSPVISEQKLLTIPIKDPRIYFRYSILVRQYNISQQAYSYWNTIQQNSEALGTLFDRQPSQLKGNIHSVKDPEETVIGFISASSATTARIFINHNELRNWEFDLLRGASCDVKVIPQNPNFLDWTYPDPNYVPWYYLSGGSMFIAKKTCLDCRTAGGVNQKPSFW